MLLYSDTCCLQPSMIFKEENGGMACVYKVNLWIILGVICLHLLGYPLNLSDTLWSYYIPL